jgi:urea transport system ATP-binding protein
VAESGSITLAIEALSHQYGDSRTLWDVTLSLEQGDSLCLMGRNGVGKTTLARCILGLERLSAGRIIMDGRPIQDLSVEQRVRLGLGYVPQGRDIFPRLTVAENLQLPLTEVRGGKVPSLVHDLFPVLHDMRARAGGDLSGGQQQQLAIARALVLKPRLLILDEPTEGIQPNVVADIAQAIRVLNEEHGITVLLIEQKLGFVRRVARRFAIMDKGRIVAAGAIGELDDGLVHRHLTV